MFHYKIISSFCATVILASQTRSGVKTPVITPCLQRDDLRAAIIMSGSSQDAIFAAERV